MASESTKPAVARIASASSRLIAMSKLSSAFNMIAIGKPACPGTCSHELHCSIDTITPPVINELIIIIPVALK